MIKIHKTIFMLAVLNTYSFSGFSQEKDLFNNLFSKWEDSTKLQPGLSIAVIENDEIVYKHSFGYANLEYKIPLNQNSVFDIASLAKQFTGFAIAKLIIEKKIDLNQSASIYLPELKILEQNIMIKHLVYHTSGLRDIGELFDLAYLGGDLTSRDAIKLLKNQTALNFVAGSEFDYSNTNYVLLALIVERVTGISFRDWCKSNLFSPLKMKNSFVNDNPFELINNRAVAYYTDDSTFSFQQNNGMALIGSSAVYSTIDDMVIWVQSLQNEKTFPAIFKLMKQNGALDNGTEIEYGFGLSIGELWNEAKVEHSGATPSGFRTSMVFFPNKSLGLILLSNWGNVNPIRDFAMEIIKNYIPVFGEETRDTVSPKPIFQLNKETIDRYVGEYLFNGELKVIIRREDDNNLSIELEGNSKKPIYPISKNEFDLPSMQSKLHFIEGLENVCQKVEVSMGGKKEGVLTRINKKTNIVLDHEKYIGNFYSDELKILFEIGLINGQLYIKNTKNGAVQLEGKTDKVFVPKDGIASSIEFIFDDIKQVTGFLLNRGSRVRDLKFEKLPENN